MRSLSRVSFLLFLLFSMSFLVSSTVVFAQTEPLSEATAFIDTTYGEDLVSFLSSDSIAKIAGNVSSSETVYSVPEADSLALVALYNSTDGPNWYNSTNWLTDNPVDTWFGITVSGGQVVLVNMQNNNLSGALPPEIGQLSRLQILVLNDNAITSIPPEIGNLTTVGLFHITHNSLTTIPPEIGNMYSLQNLHIEFNNLTSLPPELGNLNYLFWFYANSNNLTSLPPELGNLTRIRGLHFENNQLTGIPPEIGNIASLEQLYLTQNNLTTIPSEIGNLSLLRRLTADHNQLTGLPSEIGNLHKLEWLYVYNNSISSIPPEVGNMASLDQLDVSYNPLNGTIPTEITNLSNLSGLAINGIQMNGVIPPVVWQMTQLGHLGLMDNGLLCIPPDIQNLSNLWSILLDDNFLTSLPPEMNSLTNITRLRINNNLLSVFPPEILSMFIMKDLHLSGNGMSGLIPPEIGMLVNLEHLFLDNNNLYGDVPSIRHLPWLQNLYLNNNKFTFSNLAASNVFSPFSYAPQDTIPPVSETSNVGTITLSLSLIHPDNQYSWYRNDIVIPGETSLELVILDDDAGVYSAKITNPLFPDLKLISAEITIEAQQFISVAEAAESGYIHPYAYSWDGTEYVPVSVYDTTTEMQAWQGFWAMVNNDTDIDGVDLLFPASDTYPLEAPLLTVEPNTHYLVAPPIKTVITDINSNDIGRCLGYDQYEQTWRIGKWKWDTEGYHNYCRDPQYGELMSLRPGKGFWLQQITDEPMTIMLSGHALFPASGYHEVKLSANDLDVPYTYHMTGNPYWYSIKWSDCKVRIPMTESLYSAKVAVDPSALEEWHVDLKLVATEGTARDTYNRAGVVTSGDPDMLRALDLEPVGEYVRLMVNDPAQETPEFVAYDYRPDGLQSYEWEITLTTSYNSIDTYFSLDNIIDVPDGYSLVLTDNRGVSYPVDSDFSLPVTLNEGIESVFTLIAVTEPTAIATPEAPEAFGIQSTMPNPFNPSTTIQYALTSDADVTVHVYNVSGQLVDTLVDSHLHAGMQSVVWNAQGHASGLYFIALEAGSQRDVTKVMLMK